MSQSALPQTTRERIRRISNEVRLWLIAVFGLTSTVAVLAFVPSQSSSSYTLRVLDVAPQDISAPYALSYTSDVLTQQEQLATEVSVADVYDPPDSDVVRRQLQHLRTTLDFIDAVRGDEFASREDSIADLQAITFFQMDAETAAAFLDINSSRWEAVKLEAISVLEQVMRSEIREGRLEEAQRTVPALVNIAMPDEQASLVSLLATAFVAPNSAYNPEATEAARQIARESVQPVNKSYAAGEMIVSRGELVNELQLETLNAYGLLTPRASWMNIAAQSLFVLLIGTSMVLYAARQHPEQVKNARMSFVMILLFVLSVLGMQLMIPGRTVLPYVFPAASIPLLLTILYGPGMGITTAMALGAVAGYLAPRGIELGLYVMLSGTLACLVIGRVERLSSFLWAGMASAMASTAVIVIFRFLDPATDLLGKASLVGASIVSGLLSASLSFGLLLLIGMLLGITTNLQLIELSRPDHPLLQFILRNAPGTYQHSLQVANLAEQAARTVKANPLLTRVGALYHDAGKALRPHFFIENQVAGENVHNNLDPTSSANVIRGHVQEGLDLARKYRLPRDIQAFISEHHGTMITNYQYQAALKTHSNDPAQVNIADFTYPGPSPNTRETALLMLADGVEAKARADRPKDEAEIERLVQWIIDDRLKKGQLANTELTLRDLSNIKRSFVNTLINIYHPRLQYPGSAPDTIPNPPPAAASGEGIAQA
ncbi:MAG: HDIG domain-containing protein [Anaerolineales bacterium]|nr:HDIG domain-containing protein [Anaerolineales bacterium]